MIFQFDLSLLDFYQKKCLQESLDEIQSENVSEVMVLAVDLPDEFLVLTGDTLEYVCGLVYRENAYPTCLSLNRSRNLNRSHSRNRIRSLSRKRDRKRNRTHRIPVKAARFALDGRLQR